MESAVGTLQTLMPTLSMSAFRGEADVTDARLLSANDPKRTFCFACVSHEKPDSAGLSQILGKLSVKEPRLAPSWHLNGFLPTQ